VRKLWPQTKFRDYGRIEGLKNRLGYPGPLHVSHWTFPDYFLLDQPVKEPADRLEVIPNGFGLVGLLQVEDKQPDLVSCDIIRRSDAGFQAKLDKTPDKILVGGDGCRG